VAVVARKWSVCAVALVLLVVLAGAGCDKCEVCGKYMSRDLPNAFIRVEEGGVCTGHEFLAGRWVLVDGQLRVTSIRGEYVFAIGSGLLVDKDGLIWEKEST
jgi:hypothetical protein